MYDLTRPADRLTQLINEENSTVFDSGELRFGQPFPSNPGEPRNTTILVNGPDLLPDQRIMYDRVSIAAALTGYTRVYGYDPADPMGSLLAALTAETGLWFDPTDIAPFDPEDQDDKGLVTIYAAPASLVFVGSVRLELNPI